MNFVTPFMASFEPSQLLTTLFRLLLAAWCGGVIGMERRKRHRTDPHAGLYRIYTCYAD